MTERHWSQLLRIRKVGGNDGREAMDPDPAYALYGPLAQHGEPFVMGQVGQSLDGRIATPSGDAQDVSGCDGIAHLHRCRALVDGVIVGVGTVLADNPSLSVRMVEGDSPARIVVDCNGDLTGGEKLLGDGGAPVFVVQAVDVPRQLAGVETIRIARRPTGLDPLEILEALSSNGLKSILVEGGARTISRFIDAGLLDRLHISVAPIIIGSGPAGISLPPVQRLRDAYCPMVTAFDIGSDVVFDCNFRASDQAARRS